ncbi:MAG TPA: hypothetical protein VK752_04675 [Bryobacteraceae bacterium]|jgi:hypothetical protein|nr:hypothetical protein [Bryobacteraceae bacterium]
MKIWFPLVAAVLLSACSDAPVAKAPVKPPEPETGRQGFYKTYPQAHTWATDAQPIRVRSIEMKDLQADGGKAAAWEVTYASESKSRSKIYTWSALEAEGLHQGVFASQEEAWRPGGPDKPFPIQALKIDTPEALQTAITHSVTYFKNVGTKPHPKFVLEYTARYPNPSWRVYWGESVSTAEWSVFIDAATGDYQGR